MEDSKVKALAAKGGFAVPDATLDDWGVLLKSFVDAAEHVLEQEDELPRPDLSKYPRSDVFVPSAEQTDKGAWAVRCTVKCTEPRSSLLNGRTIAIKDNTALAGVRCLNGITPTEGKEWIPDYDATVVTRILDAGGVITGKAGKLNMTSNQRALLRLES